ncbi:MULTISPECIES: protein kinase domain-containing protein [unclassified Amycolatopsis]|uniref:protein kinase domain-containing protein n=1 Tax=unclassified Amycolatopsis TaxID=2618356 RepID=UPI002875ABE7|nr:MULTISPECIES: protein kinase [unclassified Amycolatopsis]MDS0133231.1 phosphotransferase [Amycolatopsis sp. 505]MDS0146461.1 phosphotransferase [Amycolatopsis sp. CM201R]
MRKGQILNGYEVVTRPTNADAGKCLWAFARKDGEQFFIKEYLDPKRPRPDSMGSVADKKRRHAECRRFELRQRQVADSLRSDHPKAGNLVLTRDFFVDGTRYYKVTERIAAADVRPHELDPASQLVLVRTLAESLSLLHETGIVHGDLKPENVLLHQPEGSRLHIAKLIDFDDAYPVGDPPPRTVVAGNPLYGAPEWLGYIRAEPDVSRKDLTGAVDVFAFALLVHTYLTGSPPEHDPRHESPAAAVRAGSPLQWDRALGEGWPEVFDAMTDADPAARPDVSAAATDIGVLLGPGRGRSPDRPAPARGRSRVRINLAGRAETRPRGRLRINLSTPPLPDEGTR